MHVNHFIQTSSWLVQRGERALESPGWIALQTEHLWPDTKIRNQRWQSALCELEPQLSSLRWLRPWLRFARLAREVIAAETLNRVWFAIAAAQSRDPDVMDLADCVNAEHAQVRVRVMQRLATAPAAASRLTSRLAKLATLNQQLTDLMLSQLPDSKVARQLSVCPALFDEFRDCATGHDAGVLKQANRLLCQRLRRELDRLGGRVGNVDLNQRMMDCMIRFLSSEANESAAAPEPTMMGVS